MSNKPAPRPNTFLQNECPVYPGEKGPERGVICSSLSNADVANGLELISVSSERLHKHVTG